VVAAAVAAGVPKAKNLAKLWAASVLILKIVQEEEKKVLVAVAVAVVVYLKNLHQLYRETQSYWLDKSFQLQTFLWVYLRGNKT
jgi:hypothetical protein